MKKIRVIIVIDDLGCGGAEKSLVSLLPLLDYTKIEVSLLADTGVFEGLVPKEVHRLSYPILKGLKYTVAQLFFSILLRIFPNRHAAEVRWMAIGKVYPKLKEEYDVAIAYQQGFPTYLVSERIYAKKKIAWINADIFEAGYNPSFNARFYQKMTHIVPVSEKLHDKLKSVLSQFAKKYVPVYDIINPSIVRQQALSSKTHNFAKGIINIVTVGRLATPKNYPLAVEAAKIIRDRGIRFCWYFVGEGMMRSTIEQMIDRYELGDCVKLVGMTTNPYPYMKDCDIYVQTSLFEGFGMTIAEAKILGRPVVTTNFDVVYDQITHEKNGLIADMTPLSVANNIIRIIDDRELYDNIIANVKREENVTCLTEVKKIEQMLYEDMYDHLPECR